MYQGSSNSQAKVLTIVPKGAVSPGNHLASCSIQTSSRMRGPAGVDCILS